MSTFCRFGLIVTGKGEEQFLPSLFRVMEAHAYCKFTVIRRVGQRNPITSEPRQLKMVGTGKLIPDRDQNDIGLPARRFLSENDQSFVILVDDLESDRRSIADDVFSRYRRAIDTLVRTNQQERAAVHFFVNMLEAYYFAHADAVNATAGRTILHQDHDSDVEEIEHPKNRLRSLWANFDEVRDGENVVRSLDLDHVLNEPEHCQWLRALVVWCVGRLDAAGAIWNPELKEMFGLPAGACSQLTRLQKPV